MTESAFADPTDLGPGGRAMWDELLPKVETSDGQIILLEACRSKDRLDKLDAILRGDVGEWASVKFDHNDEPVELVIDKAATVAVSTQNMMKQLIAVLRLPDAKGVPTGRAPRTGTGAYTGKQNVSSIERAKARARSA